MATYNPQRKTATSGTTEDIQFPISAINGLQSALNGKAASSHTHSYLPLTGGTLTGNLTITNGSSTQKTEPAIKWKTVGANTPYVGFATDQTDGTFLFGSLKGTNYQAGLAIGGGSGNLLWKGARVVTASELGTAASKGVDTSVKSGSANLVTSGAVYTAIASAITTALSTEV